MRCRVLVLLAGLLLCGPSLASDTDDCRYWRLGKDAADVASRLAACDRIIANQDLATGVRAEAYAMRADRESSNHNSVAAIADFDQALALAPDKIEWHRDRAYLLYFAEQYDRAIKDFDDVLAAKPDDGQATFFRGLAWLDKKDDVRGFADLAKGIALAPKGYWYPYQRAVELVKRDKSDEALPDLDKAISLKGDEPNPYLLRADIYDKRGETDKAVADLTRVAEIDPSRAYLNRAFLYERTGQYDRAIADFDKLISLEPNDAYAKERRAKLLEKTAARTDTPAPAADPLPKVPEVRKSAEPEKAPEAPKAAEPQPEPKKEAERAPDGKHECRRYVAISNMTISVPCPD